MGYAQAEDQLENLVKNYRRAAGRSAEFEGSSTLPMDHLVRQLRIPQRADAHFEQLEPKHKEHLVAFANGVNAVIAARREKIPAWIEPIKPQDVLRFYTYVDVIFTVDACRGDLGLHGIKLAGLQLPADHAGLAYGSNQFAVSPRRSASGTAQLSMDPHLPLSGFYRWYEMHLVGPEINWMGACFFGSPYISMGRTERTARCMTVNGPDLGDVFSFAIDPQDSGRYKDIDGWKQFDDYTETYQVLEGDKLVESASCPAVKHRRGLS